MLTADCSFIASVFVHIKLQGRKTPEVMVILCHDYAFSHYGIQAVLRMRMYDQYHVAQNLNRIQIN